MRWRRPCSASARAASTRRRRRSRRRWCARRTPGRAAVAARACGVLELQRLDCAGVVGLTETALARRGGMPLGEQLAPHFARLGVDPHGPAAQPGTLDASLQRFAAETLRRQLAELAGRNVEDGAIVVLDNASRRGARLGRLERALVVGRRGRRRARAAPAGLDPQALRLRAGVREAADHAGDAARRLAGADRHRRRALPAAELRPRMEGLRQRAHRPRRQPQRAGGARRRPARAGCPAPATARPRLRPAGERRLVRRVAGARQRRRLAADADQRVPRARQRRALLAGRAARRRDAAAGARRRSGGGVPGHRHPRRQQRPRPHLRPRQHPGDARLRGGEDRHQQGHARQLVRRLHRPLHHRRLDRQRQRRGDAQRQRRQRRGADLACTGRRAARRVRSRSRRAHRPA